MERIFILLSIVHSAAIRGVDMLPVIIEVDVSEGLPVLEMVGLLNSEVREAKERVRTAVKNMGVRIPPKRITINLSPADVRKEGGAFDLPIALGILQSIGLAVFTYNMEETVIVGELSLSGGVNPVKGVIAIAAAAREKGYKKIIVPEKNGGEAAAVKGMEVISVSSLKETVEVLTGRKAPSLESFSERDFLKRQEEQTGKESVDFGDVNGQEILKRAALVAAAGRHNILFVGPPGSGKTMVASRLATILPTPGIEDCIEITKLYSIAGELRGESIITKRPFRSPHHTITAKAMAGGGNNVRPGEISLAHKGVLFLDEMAEFKREALEVLRQPMEQRSLVINRTSGSYSFPADIMLAAAMNPCRCGYYPDRSKCRCTEYEVKKYMGKISGPLLNRLDIVVGAPVISVSELQKSGRNVTSAELRKQVEAADIIQRERYKKTTIGFNGELEPKDIKKYCYLGGEAKEFLRAALEALGISARTYYKIIKVARTIADLDGSINIRRKHIAEAVGYRPGVIFESGRGHDADGSRI